MNTFGRNFRVSIFGESHGNGIGVVIDGVPAGISLSDKDFDRDIQRRRSGAKGTTPRREDDIPQILSGVLGGRTTGAPLAIMFKNNDTRSSDYSLFKETPRPGHADFVAGVKWHDFNDPRGGGHFSGRLTLPVVAAGVVAKKVIAQKYPATFEAVLTEVGGVSRQEALARAVAKAGQGQPAAGQGRPAEGQCQSSEGRSSEGQCRSSEARTSEARTTEGQCHFSDSELWRAELDAVQQEGDSLGGIVECTVNRLPVGLGAPFFDSVESLISHAVFSIPGVRGIEFGDGFRAPRMKGSEHNDPITDHDGRCSRNGAGGVNGGLTNGNPLVFRVAFKPTASIRKAQQTFNFTKGEVTTLEIPGRHDVCFALRTPVVVEAMAAIVLADLIPTE